MSTDDLIAAKKRMYCLGTQAAVFDFVLDNCASPIEKLFVAAIQGRVRDLRGLIVIDVALVSNARSIAIELDGHDFHERTKEQARQDRSRERRLIALGWTVVRFTGSEVHGDVNACVREALSIFAPPARSYVDQEQAP